jgi:hypothetical protein
MAFIDNNVSIETRFQLDNSPKNFKITDNADYVGTYGIALADVEGVLKIVDPNGNTVHQTVFPAVDIDLDVSTFIDTIALPLDANNEVLKGNYTITYTVEVTGATDPGTYEKSFIYKYCYDGVDMDIDLTVDLICAQLTSTDNTSYPQEVTTTTRTHTVHPPSGLDATEWPVQTVSTQNNIYSKDGNKIATKTWTGKVVNILELTYSDGLIVDVTVTGNSERDIQDDINICNLQCNMRALVDRYYTALGTNTVNADEIYRDQLAPSLAGAFMYTSNIQCGNFDLAEKYYQDVLTFTGSQPDCACSDSDEPEIIFASCSGGGSGQTYVVDACNTNNALTVTSNTIGDTTTFTVCFNQTLFDKLSALTETVIQSTDGSITITSNTVGYTTTWDIKTNTALPAASAVHSFSGIMDIDLFTNAIPTLAWDANYNTLVGNKLQLPTITNTNTVLADWNSLQNCFYLEGYVDQSGGEFPIPQMQVTYAFPAGADSFDPCFDVRDIFINIVEINETDNRIYFQFVDRANQLTPTGGGRLSLKVSKLRVSVIINA